MQNDVGGTFYGKISFDPWLIIGQVRDFLTLETRSPSLATPALTVSVADNYDAMPVLSVVSDIP